MITGARVLAVAVIAVLVGRADAAVLCARRHAGGTFDSAVKVREVCRPTEVTLTPDQVGFCCTTSTTTSTTLLICPTPTTMGPSICSGTPPACGGQCPGGQTCTDDGLGHCGCIGPSQCGGPGSFCGGACPAGQTCQQLPVPAGCPSIGCTCQ